MQAFEILNGVLEVMYEDIPGATEGEKDKAVIAALDDYSTAYADLKDVNTANHSPHVNRFAYIYKHVAVHADAVCSCLHASAELSALFSKEMVDVASFGGGPGSDLLGMLKYMETSGKSPYLTSYLYDRERGWSDCWNTVGKKTKGSHSLNVSPTTIDVCVSQDIQYLKSCFTADLMTMVFFISEVYSRRNECESFLKTVFTNAKPGSYFLYIDNGDRESVFDKWMESLVLPNGFSCITSQLEYIRLRQVKKSAASDVSGTNSDQIINQNLRDS